MNKRVPTSTVIDILKNYKEYIDPQKEESLELSYAIQRGIEGLERKICWISIDKYRPIAIDADKEGWILIKYSKGKIRKAKWTCLLRSVKEFEGTEQWDDVISWARVPEDEW